MGIRITEVIKNILIVNVLIFIATIIEPLVNYRPYLMMWNPLGDSDNFKFYQVFTHMFMHADFRHLFFNMLVLVMLGPAIESRLGGIKFLFFYIISGLGAMLLHVLASQLGAGGFPMLGASGAINGVLVAFMMFYPNQRLMLLFPPIPIKAKYLIGGLLLIDVFMGTLGSGSNVAHFAHIGGALAGFLLITIWRKQGEI
ncbi:MAG: rhomboid family intramembrane serine protease [Saprospiraceae bacterium]